ncbi:MAG: response regulator transcription factor [Prolixibacteraceae bacterium]|nr:response regulator transcription factor [Prolixibacteraceae bacterium]
MIRTLIVEDEEPAARRLEKLLCKADSEIEIAGKLESVSSTVHWLSTNPQPDLIMLDIQLADGLSFEIFKKVRVDSFVIFTTAYDEYAIKAFELNSIDYLLKPVDTEKLASAIEKYRRLSDKKPTFRIDEIIQFVETQKNPYKKRFAITIGSRIKSVEADDIACFYSLEKSTFLCTFEGGHFPVDFSLDRLEEILDPQTYFRVNRQTIVQYKAILKIHVLSKSRLELEIAKLPEKILVSTAKSHQFRQWIDK